MAFDGNTVGLPSTCLFVGRYNPSCGGSAVAVFAGDGTALVVGVMVSQTAPIVYLPGQVLSKTDAKIVRWRPDLQLATSARAGTAALEDGGKTLRVQMPSAPLLIGDCPFSDFVGHFAAMGSAPSQGSPVSYRQIAARVE